MVARTLLAVVLTLLLAGVAEASPGSVQRGRTCRSFFRVLPYLTHVTATAIRVNMIPEDSFDLRVSLGLPTTPYGVVPGVTAQVIQTGATADVRTHLVAAPNATFTGLTAGTQFKYLVECRTNSLSPWNVVQKAYFRTLRTNAADVYRVAFVADTHHYQFWHQNRCGNQTNSYATVLQTIRNLRKAGIDFLIDMGDTQMIDFGGQACQVNLDRENGTSYATTNAASNEDLVEMAARYEVHLRDWQPILAFVPIFETWGNHEAIHGFGGAGAAQLCGFSQNGTNAALTASQAWFGNYNDAYPNDSGTIDYDGDTAVEAQTDGLYYEWVSGAMRWFLINPTRYRADTRAAGAHADNAFPGFVARTADTQYAGFGAACPAPTPFTMGADSWEDNNSMGATQVGWFIARTNAKAETWGAVLSHEAISGFPASPTNSYWYQRGSLATRIDPTTGRRLTTTAWDADADNDLSEDHYVTTQMALRTVQFRVHGHDHVHVICRKSGIHFLELGAGHGGTFGNSPGLPWNTNPGSVDQALIDSYDCDEDGFADYDPGGFWNIDRSMKRNVQNGGVAGTTGTGNPGYGLLQINGVATANWSWIVSDTQDAIRNGTPVIQYGPITP